MFAKDSRYIDQEIIEVGSSNGDTVSAVTLRRLKAVRGGWHTVKQNDRLDLMAYRQYKKPDHFWYIADANTELEAGRLVCEPGRNILLPEV
jgi:hypothetical protein